MCGIISGCSYKNIIPDLLSGLKRLEYRGYDSAGVAGLQDLSLTVTKRVGKVHVLEKASNDLHSHVGIAHTRWATHGKPTERNAHPHAYDHLAWVHNGIIHNHAALRRSLEAEGHTFSSATDSEVIGHVFARARKQHSNHLEALHATCHQLQGSYALVLMDMHVPDRLFFACHKSPLVIGLGHQEMFMASDMMALFNMATSFVYLQNNHLGYVTATDYHVHDLTTLKPVAVDLQPFNVSCPDPQNAQHKHHMHKEIFEQPDIIERCLGYYLQDQAPSGHLRTLLDTLTTSQQKPGPLHFVGCGSSLYAAMIGQRWFEQHQHRLTYADISSEFRHKTFQAPDHALLLALSQSGETADTLYAIEHAKTLGYQRFGTLCNVPHSTMVRETQVCFPLLAGQEIGVASTKAFLTQLLVLKVLSLFLDPTTPPCQETCDALQQLPTWIAETLALEATIENMANKLSHQQQLLFLGRGLGYPTALEGALKLKELSYIHAHAYPAGELKHGPLALVDHQLVTIGLLPNDPLRAKNLASFREVQARNGQLVVLYQGSTQDLCHLNPLMTLCLPDTPPTLSPFVFTVALQLLSYHIAKQLGYDVDQPRNLAKSVTVE